MLETLIVRHLGTPNSSFPLASATSLLTTTHKSKLECIDENVYEIIDTYRLCPRETLCFVEPRLSRAHKTYHS